MENRANHKTVIRVPNKLWDEIVKLAGAESRSINGEVVYLLGQALADRLAMKQKYVDMVADLRGSHRNHQSSGELLAAQRRGNP